MKTKTLIQTAVVLSLTEFLTVSATGATLATENLFVATTKVRKPGSTATVVAAVADNSDYTENLTAAPVTWSNTVTGFTQARAELLGATVADVQLASYIELDGSSLTFGRELTTEVLLAGTSLTPLLNDIAGVSLIQSWDSTASVGATIEAGNTYRVTFDVTDGLGLPVDLLDSASVQLDGTGIRDTENNIFTTLNLIDLITLGDGIDDEVTIDFIATEDTNSLDFSFFAQTLADASALGGSAGNQEFISFSNLTVTPIPEPSTSMLSIVAAFLLTNFRRRSHRRS